MIAEVERMDERRRMLDLAIGAADRRLPSASTISRKPTPPRIIFVSKAPSIGACGKNFWLQILDEALPRLRVLDHAMSE